MVGQRNKDLLKGTINIPIEEYIKLKTFFEENKYFKPKKNELKKTLLYEEINP